MSIANCRFVSDMIWRIVSAIGNRQWLGRGAGVVELAALEML